VIAKFYGAAIFDLYPPKDYAAMPLSAARPESGALPKIPEFQLGSFNWGQSRVLSLFSAQDDVVDANISGSFRAIRCAQEVNLESHRTGQLLQ
jgi:hypothetical protein